MKSKGFYFIYILWYPFQASLYSTGNEVPVHSRPLKGVSHKLLGGYCYISMESSFQGLSLHRIKFYFIKGSVHNLQKTGRRTFVQWYLWFYPDNIEIARKWVFPQYWNLQQPLWVIWYHGKVLIHHISGLSLGFMSSYYCANKGIPAFQYGR